MILQQQTYLCSFKSISSSEILLASCRCSLRKFWKPAKMSVDFGLPLPALLAILTSEFCNNKLLFEVRSITISNFFMKWSLVLRILRLNNTFTICKCYILFLIFEKSGIMLTFDTCQCPIFSRYNMSNCLILTVKIKAAICQNQKGPWKHRYHGIIMYHGCT